MSRPRTIGRLQQRSLSGSLLRRAARVDRRSRCLATAAAADRADRADDRVHIVEVGPRDGLQNEKGIVALRTKLQLIERLAHAGLRTIEAGSFVSPKWVPQMADSADVLEHILAQAAGGRHDGVKYQFLLPNMKGLESLLAVYDRHRAAAGASPATPTALPDVELSVFTAATESFSQKNTNCSIADTLKRFEPLMATAKARSLRLRAYISVALGCPFEGPGVDPHRVASIATTLLEMGADEVSIGDTTGMGTAPRTAELLRVLSAAGIRSSDLALHLHDTFGQAVMNAAVGLEHGIRTFDAAIGGLGGCPFSPGATGNVPTEDLVYTFESLGMKTGVDLKELAEIGHWISAELGRENESRAGKAVLSRARLQGNA